MNIDENECAFYEITIKNQNATLQSQIIINQDYPKVYPLFLININWKHDRNNTNDEAVRVSLTNFSFNSNDLILNAILIIGHGKRIEHL